MTRFILIACIITFVSNSLAQEQLKHEIKSHTAEDGKLFWNKKLPVYLRIASSPADTGQIMQSEVTKQYTNPYYFDTEGKNKIRSRWATDQQTKKTITPQIEVIWEVYADGLAPFSKITDNYSSKYFDGKNVYYGPKLSINISSNDANSGVEQLYSSVNGSNYSVFNQPIVVNEEGEHTIKYYAVDNVGNIEKPKEKKLIIDLTAPKTNYQISGISSGNIIAVSTKIHLSAEDNLSGVAKTYYKIDEEKETLYKPGTSIPISHLADGNHKLYFYSVDKVKNIETKEVYPFYLDKIGPIIASDILGDRYLMGETIFFSGRSKLILTAVDNKAGVKSIFYSIDNKKFIKYDNAFYLPSTTGVHIVRYYAVDKADNYSGKGKNRYEKYQHVIKRIYVDLLGPVLSHKFSNPIFKTRDTVFISTKTKLKLMAVDNESKLKHISYSLDGQPDETKYTEPIQFSEPGFHKLTYFGYDNVNNRNRAELTFYVDTIGPKINHDFSILKQGIKLNLPIYPFHATLFLAATDKHVGTNDIFYSINKGKFKKYSITISGFKLDAINTVDIKATDYLNNETKLEIKFYIKR